MSQARRNRKSGAHSQEQPQNQASSEQPEQDELSEGRGPEPSAGVREHEPPPAPSSIRLAQNVQLKVDGKLQILRAGEVVDVGQEPGHLPPEYLKRQPLLDLSHPKNLKAVAARRALTEKIEDSRKHVSDKAAQAARRIGKPRRTGLF